ncbi:MAG: hypothetical protein ABIH09_03960 [Candidatus Omnitrophota bacterium]
MCETGLKRGILLIFTCMVVLLADTSIEAKDFARKYAGIDGTEIPVSDTASEKDSVPPEHTPHKGFLPEHEHGRDDPFNPNFSSKGYQNPSAVNLQGIVSDGGESHAIINGNIVSVGDKVGNNTVLEIKENSVVVNDGSENIEIKLLRRK